jgi:hypothetical protein
MAERREEGGIRRDGEGVAQMKDDNLTADWCCRRKQKGK